MANKNVSKYSEQWRKASKLVAGRVARLREQGFQINYSINRPQNIRKEDIEWLRGLTTEKIKQGKSTKRFTINIEEVGYDTRPSRVSPVRDHTVSSDTKEYNPPKPTKAQQNQRNRLHDLGLTDEQIDYGLSEGISLQEQLSNDEYFDALEETVNTDIEETIEPGYEYYIDTDTGEIFAPDDPQIYARKANRYVVDRTGSFVVKDTLEHHIDAPLSGEELEELKWSHFIGSFKEANVSHFSGINPLPYFEELHTMLSADQINEVLNELSDYSSNVGDMDFWYLQSPNEQGERFNAFLQAIDKKYGTDTSELRRQFNAENEHFVYQENLKELNGLFKRNINL